MLIKLLGDPHSVQRHIVAGAAFGLSAGISAAITHLNFTNLTVVTAIAAGVAAWLSSGRANVEQ